MKNIEIIEKQIKNLRTALGFTIVGLAIALYLSVLNALGVF